MSDSWEEQGWVQMGVATALAKEFESDQRPFLQLLAKTLDQALPGEAEIKTQGWFSNKTVVAVAVTLGDLRFTIFDPGRGSLQATSAKIVRGICLKTDPVSVQEALAGIGEGLEARAKQSAAARNALAAMLGLN